MFLFLVQMQIVNSLACICNDKRLNFRNPGYARNFPNTHLDAKYFSLSKVDK